MNLKNDYVKGLQLKVAAFYLFQPLDEDAVSLILDQLSISADKYNVNGTVLVALEGINGTICGSFKGVDALLVLIGKLLSNDSLQVKISWTDKQAFRRFRIRRKAEIVTMGIQDVNPHDSVGVYVEPSDWNELLNDPNTIVIDTRNEYEIGIGGFEGSLNPHTRCFRQFPEWVQKELHPLVKDRPTARIAMYCTGGIRCEKATSYLIKEGFKDVYHLHGGILRYLEETPKEDSLWEGECFVFDQRVALNQNLIPGVHILCHACGMPLSPTDVTDVSYIAGVQCNHCKDLYSDKDRVRFAERQRQFEQQSVQALVIEDSKKS